jgi:BlaI family penicillinase repressor
MRRPDPTLTPQELAIMKLIWRRRTATVREVYEELRESRRVAYTTVMTMMSILTTKGYLKREKEDRAFRYRPTRPEQAVVTAIVREFVDRVFDGAAHPLLLHLVRQRKLAAKDREEILRLIEDIK